MKSNTSWLAVVLTAVVVWAASTQLDHAQPAAAPAGGTKVAVVDLVRVFNDFEQTKVLGLKMQEDTARVQDELHKKSDEIKAEQATLQRFAPDSADWYTRSKKLRQMQMEAEVYKALEGERIQADFLRWTKRTYKMATDETASVAKRKGFDLVITREELDMSVMDPEKLNQLKAQILNRKVVYHDPSVDLTEEVLASLNDAFAKAGGAASVKFSR